MGWQKSEKFTGEKRERGENLWKDEILEEESEMYSERKKKASGGGENK